MMNDDDSKWKKAGKSLRDVNKGMNIPYLLAAGPIGGGFLGFFIGKWAGNEALGFMLGFFIGIAVAFREILKHSKS